MAEMVIYASAFIEPGEHLSARVEHRPDLSHSVFVNVGDRLTLHVGGTDGEKAATLRSLSLVLTRAADELSTAQAAEVAS